jgi:uncharacterized membrane protein
MKVSDIILALFYFVFIPAVIGAIAGTLGYGMSYDLATAIIMGIAVFIAILVMPIIAFYFYAKSPPNIEESKKDQPKTEK